MPVIPNNQLFDHAPTSALTPEQVEAKLRAEELRVNVPADLEAGIIHYDMLRVASRCPVEDDWFD